MPSPAIAKRLLVAVAASACTGVGSTSNAPPTTIVVAAIERADSLVREADALSDAKQYSQAGHTYGAALAQRTYYPGRSVAAYNAACMFSLSGQADSAFAYLRASLAAGFRDTTLLFTDADLSSLRALPEWPDLAARAREVVHAYAAARSDPKRLHLVTTDITNFWEAYDLARNAPTFSARTDIFRRRYLEVGSHGLIDFFYDKVGSLDRFVRGIDSMPKFFGAIRPGTLAIAAQDGRLRADLARLAALYPAATFPDVYFVVGRLTSGGTVSGQGLLIGAEMASVSPSTPLDELPPSIRRIVSGPDELAFNTVHELVHFQQSMNGTPSLLRNAIIEGSASFIASLIDPPPRPPIYMSWGAAHERSIWARFAAHMHENDVSQWIGGNDRATDEWPADLGYFVGFEIAKGFYDASSDKSAAIRDLLALKDPDAVLAASGYERRMSRQ